MIKNKYDLKIYLIEDAKANQRKSIKAKFWGDEIWKYIVCLRKTEYYKNKGGLPFLYLFWKYKLHKYSLKLGFQIPLNVFDYGLSLPHFGTVVVAERSKVGKYCKIHEGVTIGATNGSNLAAVLGDRVFIGSGAKIIGDVFIANDCVIAANAVVVKSIEERGTSWGGVPAKKISNNNSFSNLQYYGQ